MKRTPNGEKNIKFKMLKIFSVLALATVITLTGFAQNPTGAGNAHKAAHAQLLAKNSSRLDASVIAGQVQQEVKSREAQADGLTPETAILIDDLLAEAQSHIGKRYRSGAKGPGTFDCSGFSGYVYRQFGYSIGAYSRDQYKIGKNIDRKDLRKGDLVFFTSRSSGKNVGHVGIVWEVDNETGNFKFIHASVRGVRISDFEGYYVGRYVGARRVIE